MTEEVRNAVIGNVGTFISFRVGSTDAIIMEREFAPSFTQEDMVNLGFAQIYLKLMIDGMSSRPFSATTLPPIPKPEKSYIADILGYSRKHYGKTREQIDTDIRKWTNKDYHLENVKFAEEKKKKGIKDPVSLTPTGGASVFLNEMSGYDMLLQKEAENLKKTVPSKQSSTTAPIPAPTPILKANEIPKRELPKLDDVELDKIVEELLKGVDANQTIAKTGEVARKELVPKSSSSSRRKVLQDLQSGFTKKKNHTTKTTKVPSAPKDDEIPEDVLRSLLGL
jgi:hypothetical protein